MSIATLAELQSAIQSWAPRDDADTVGKIPDFIALAETRLYRMVRARVNEKVTTDLAFSGVEAQTVPDDFLEARAILQQGSTRVPLLYRAPDAYFEESALQQAGTGRIFTQIGQKVLVHPAPSSTGLYTLYYHFRWPRLSATQTTNVVLTEHADLYLYAGLLELATYVKDGDARARWEGFLREAMRAMQLADERDRFRGSVLEIPAGVPVV